MQINNECVRDLLLTIEKVTTYKCTFDFYGVKSKYETLSDYEGDMLSYHIRYLLMSDILFAPDEIHNEKPGEFHVDLTPKGHEFLNTIRDGKVWSKTKELIGDACAFSLKIVSATAEGVAKAYLTQKYGIPFS